MNNVNKFNQNEYDKQYKKDHYKTITLRLKPDTADYITDAAKSMGISRAALLTKGALYIIDNGINIDEVD